MGFEPGLFVWPPLRLAWIERSSLYRSVSLHRWFSHLVSTISVRGGEGSGVEEMGRPRDARVVAICEDGRVRSAGRVPSTPEGLRLLAESLLPTDRVALDVTGSCWEVARILEPFVDRVIVVSRMTLASAARARTPTSSTLAPWRACCGKGSLTRCGCPMSAAGSCIVGSRAASS